MDRKFPYISIKEEDFMGTTGQPNKENFSFFPAPSQFEDSSFLRGWEEGAASERTPFLQETELLQAGSLCNFFVIESFGLKDEKIYLDAEISMTKRCRDIKMRAKLYDVTDQEKLLITFDVQEKKDYNEMHYLLDQPLDSSVGATSDRELELVVGAQWQDASGKEDFAAISESAEHDLAEWTVVRPKVEREGYITYPGATEEICHIARGRKSCSQTAGRRRQARSGRATRMVIIGSGQRRDVR